MRDKYGEKAMEITEAIGFLSRLGLMGYKVRPRFDHTGQGIHVGTPKRYHQACAQLQY